jgi:hypothetical protein
VNGVTQIVRTNENGEKYFINEDGQVQIIPEMLPSHEIEDSSNFLDA